MSSLPPDDDRTVIRPSAARAAPQPQAALPPATPDDTANTPAVVHAPDVAYAGEAPGAVQPPALPPAPESPPPVSSLPEAGAIKPVAVPEKPPAPASPPESEAALPIGTSLGEFEVTSLLGEGGFGIVYLAQDHSLDRRVALKEYMPQALATRSGGTPQVQVRSERHRETFAAGLKSFVNEAKLLAQFDHPSLVKVYRFWEAHGTAYMVMPYYQGVTLKQQLKTLAQPPDEAWLMKLLAPLTEALAVIHAEHCYHRDIAPDNVILLAGSNRPLLLDFGAARRVIGDMTQALTVILKPGYAPVEQYAEAPEMKQGPWTDVYALAASIYFAIVGKTPPPSVGRLLNDNYVPLAVSFAGRYSDGFLRAIDKALSVRPEDRTPSIDALRADLGLPAHRAATEETRMIVESAGGVPRTGVGGGSGTASVGPSAPGSTTGPAARPAKAAARAGWRLGAVAVGVLAVGGAAAYFALASRGPAPAAPLAAATPASAVTLAPVPASTPAAATAATPIASRDLPQAAGRGGVPAETLPPAVTASTASGFDIQAEFAAAVAGQSAGYEVTATSARERLRVGRDRLAFKVRSARGGYVTVLVVDSDGGLTQLIPSKEMRNVRIRAGETLGLPPADVGIVAAEPAGAENFLVLVSSAPRDYQAMGVRSEGGYTVFPSASELAAARSRVATTGLPPLLGKSQGCTPAASPGCNDYGAARFDLEVVR